MRLLKIILVFFMMTVFNSLCITAKVVKDTLYTTDGDRIIVKYDVSHTNGQYTISFKDQHKKLGNINGGKYQDLSKIAVMFFDRSGDFSGDVSIKNMVPEKMKFSGSVRYQKSSDDGFFVVQEEPTLVFSVKDEGEIIIPLYLANHSKKSKYELFTKSKGIKISIKPTSRIVQQSSTTTQVSEHSVTSTTEVETDDKSTLIVLQTIKEVKHKLKEEEKITDGIKSDIDYLRNQKRAISDPNIITRINEVLDMYDEKVTSLEAQAKAEQEEAAQEAADMARREDEARQAKNDSIVHAQNEQAEKAKKKNFWMIIGGIILFVLAFVGNQVLQSIRNARNQKRMMNMQQSIVNKAENEAKKKAQQAVRSARNRTVAKASNAVRKTTTIKVNGKHKNLSI